MVNKRETREVKRAMIILATGLIFLIIGIACLFFAQRIQEYTIDLYTHGKGLAKFNPFIEWVKTPKYLFSLRAVGLLALFVFGLSIYALLYAR